MTQCRIRKFCEGYKIHIGTYDPKRKKIFPRTAKQKVVCGHNHKNH